MNPDESSKATVDVERVASAAAAAAESGFAGERRALVLDAVADGLDRSAAEIIRTAAEETALTEGELAPEFARMTGTLRMFAGVVRERSWVRAAIDTAAPDPAGAIGPNHDLRRMLVPFGGAVAVFGASNFPLAYGVCGGDTASALAAGCGVVVKEHPAHPRTGRLLTSIARGAIGAAGVPEDLLGYIPNPDPEDFGPARELVSHREICAVGFTGSRDGGTALERIARERTTPIPVFAEMGSTNRVIICPHALTSRGPAIAAELAASILSRHGQQCTKPGLIFLHHDPASTAAFVSELARLMDAAPPRRMLSNSIISQYTDRCNRLKLIPHVTVATSRKTPDTLVNDHRCAVPMLFAAVDHTAGRDNLDDLQMFTPGGAGYWLNDEIFGPAAVVLGADGFENCYYTECALATSVYADPEDLEELVERDDSGEIEGLAFQPSFALSTTGRLTFNSVPTGVRVCHAMVQGGPFPATNRPDTTAVGPFAIERWCRPVCFQNCPDALLPPELRDTNPLNIRRLVNGQWQTGPLPTA